MQEWLRVALKLAADQCPSEDERMIAQGGRRWMKDRGLMGVDIKWDEGK